ncbi:MAG: hypothetical protein JSW64_08315 [Candidatus Zixiibacteriota bacterium]|nr:MAG: hypothetical protein JSW64_08315 [candidate division Zixibacteria bacterium]
MKNKLSECHCGMLIGAICALIIMLTGIGASADESSDVDVKIERVALFKNGLGYVTSSATLPKGATDIRIRQLPVPSHGTFWVGYPEDLKVRALFTSMENADETVPALNIAELLKCNLGKKVTVSTNMHNIPAITGTIVEVTRADEQAEPPSPYFMDARSLTVTHMNRPGRATPLVVIKTESGNVVLRGGSIIRADFEEDDITTSVSDILKQPSIRMELEKESKGQKVGVSYLARGIAWTPSYLIDISDSKTAKLSAKAVVINEVADLREIHLDLVTGFPNARFGDVNSPVAMNEDLAAFLRALKTGKSINKYGDVTTQRVGMSFLGASSGAVSKDISGPIYPTAQEGIVAEDLFLYPVESFTLNRGETACLPLFTEEIPYKHIYIWNIPDMLDENERYRKDISEGERAILEEVWHSCRMVNNMEMPWTTAAAEFVKDGQFTGQDICYYTPPGAETTIRINRAMNIQAEQTELELERERSAARFHGYDHDLVKLKGEMKLKNRLDKDVIVEVTKNLSGEVLGSVPEAEDTPTAMGLKWVNPRHILVWEIELKAGREQKLTYIYEVYVRR